MIVYIAQIQQIPESVKEAARIDGANSWQLMRYIILPLMMPAFTIGLFLSISSSFKMFDQNLALTQGGIWFCTGKGNRFSDYCGRNRSYAVGYNKAQGG